MTGFELYRHYVALSAHFNTKTYDYIKMNGKTNAKRSSYEKRKDKNVFEKLAKRKIDYMIPFLISNFIARDKLWIGDIALNSEAMDNYLFWLGKKARLYSDAREELGNVAKFMVEKDISFKRLFAVERNQHPVFFKLLQQGFISLETYLITNEYVGFTPYFEDKLENDIIFEKWNLKLMKYLCFMNLSKDKCSSIVQDTILKIRH